MTYALCDHICTEQTDRHVCQYVADDLEHVVRYADRERSRWGPPASILEVDGDPNVGEAVDGNLYYTEAKR